MGQNRVGPTLSKMGSELNKEPKPDGTQPSSHHTLTTGYRPWNALYDYYRRSCAPKVLK